MGQQHRRIGEQAAPVAGMLAVLAQIDHQIEIEHAAAAEEQRRPVRLDPRAGRGQQQIGGQAIPVAAADLAQARRADLAAGLQQELGIEAQAAALGEHAAQRREVDQVLALVVGDAAAVDPAHALDQAPGAEPLAPFALEAAHHVAVAVDQHARQIGVLDALGQQQRAAERRIDQHLAHEAHLLEHRPHVLGEVEGEIGRAARLLALGRHRDQPGQLAEEDAAIVVARRTLERGLPARRRASCRSNCVERRHHPNLIAGGDDNRVTLRLIR